MKFLKYHFVFLISLAFSAQTMFAVVNFRSVSPENDTLNAKLIERIDESVSALLTEINDAYKQDRNLNLNGLEVPSRTKDKLNLLWKYIRFVIPAESLEEQLQKSVSGFQIRNLPIEYKKTDSNSFNPTSLILVLSKNGDIKDVILSSLKPEDIRQTPDMNNPDNVMNRLEMITWLENYNLMYFLRDLNSLRDILNNENVLYAVPFSEQEQKTETINRKETPRNVMYLINLEHFMKSKDFDFSIDKISLVPSPEKPFVYLMQMHQKINGKSYSVSEWFSMVWDYYNPENPQIHLFFIQDDREVEKNGLVSFSDFFIP